MWNVIMPNDKTPLDDDGAAPVPGLRLLRGLVTALSVTMIIGMVIVTSLLVMRLQSKPPLLPEEISLPDGATATAITTNSDWVLVLDQNQQLHVFDRLSGTLHQTVQIRAK